MRRHVTVVSIPSRRPIRDPATRSISDTVGIWNVLHSPIVKYHACSTSARSALRPVSRQQWLMSIMNMPNLGTEMQTETT